MVRVEGYTHAAVHAVLGAVEVPDFAGSLEDLAGQVAGNGFVGAGHQQHEFIAAHAGDGGAGGRAGGKPCGHDAQQFVAGMVTQAVVDVLEAVQVDEHQREPRVVAH